LRLTGTERGVAEVAAVAEHVAGLTSTAAAFDLRPDVPHPAADGVPTVPLLDETSASDAAATLAEIRAWAKETLDIDHIPGVWRALAHLPRLLEATWRKDRLVLGAGVLDELVKGCAGLAVAQFRQSPYWIRYLTHFLRTRCGLGDRGVVEWRAPSWPSTSCSMPRAHLHDRRVRCGDPAVGRGLASVIPRRCQSPPSLS
jgi:hypothetical protein